MNKEDVVVGTIGLASIGVGWWGAHLAERSTAGGRAKLVACFARSPEKREAFADLFGCRAATSFGEVLSDPEVDGVIIATAHTSHLELIEAAAAAGKHVFVEKPLTLELMEARAAVAAAEAAGIVVQVGHQRRRAPGNRKMKSLLEDGTLGHVQVIASHHHSPNGLRMPDTAWRRSPDESPLGSMTSLAVHSLDTFLYLCGPIQRIFTATRPPREGRTIDEATALTVEFESGVLGSILTSFFVPALVEMSIHGSHGAAFSRDDATRLSLTLLEPAGTEELELAAVDPVEEELTEFVRAIAGEVQPETGVREGLAVVAALAAAVESARTGAAVVVAR
ncbi:MAG TPA: Gfo/Idh/MocA family oxidoreductase [Acidimicrobiia bacterium]|nr:Gfo/Idh/MocA family oxidoreductase [Acidimicrobiia bacterium]